MYLKKKATKQLELEQSKRAIVDEWNARKGIRDQLKATVCFPSEEVRAGSSYSQNGSKGISLNTSYLSTSYNAEYHMDDIDSGEDSDIDNLESGGFSNTFSDSDGNRYEYVKDSDVEVYLQGLLWVLKMYSEGNCPDISYSFMGRYPPCPSRIVKYLLDHIEGSVTGNCITSTNVAWLRSTLQVPTSDAKPLSAEATSGIIVYFFYPFRK